MAFVLAPSAPLSAWLAEVDKWSRNSPDFVVGRAIILDLAGVALSQSGISQLLEMLAERGIRVMGLEGAHPDQLGPKAADPRRASKLLRRRPPRTPARLRRPDRPRARSRPLC